MRWTSVVETTPSVQAGNYWHRLGGVYAFDQDDLVTAKPKGLAERARNRMENRRGWKTQQTSQFQERLIKHGPSVFPGVFEQASESPTSQCTFAADGRLQRRSFKVRR